MRCPWSTMWLPPGTPIETTLGVSRPRPGGGSGGSRRRDGRTCEADSTAKLKPASSIAEHTQSALDADPASLRLGPLRGAELTCGSGTVSGPDPADRRRHLAQASRTVFRYPGDAGEPGCRTTTDRYERARPGNPAQLDTQPLDAPRRWRLACPTQQPFQQFRVSCKSARPHGLGNTTPTSTSNGLCRPSLSGASRCPGSWRKGLRSFPAARTAGVRGIIAAPSSNT